MTEPGRNPAAMGTETLTGMWSQAKRKKREIGGDGQRAAIAPTSDWKILNPSVPPSSGSAERSGWGIMPRTLRPGLQMPAILSRDPLGLASGVMRPSEVE